MAFRPLKVLVLALIWAATAIIPGAHATEHQMRTVVKLHHHHEHKCRPHGKIVPCKTSNHDHKVRRRFTRHGAWVITNETDAAPGPMSSVVDIAERYDGLTERGNRSQLAQLFADSLDISIDPRRTAWCAAFVNSVLAQAGKPTSGSIESISFIAWGHAVKSPEGGDVVVMKGVSRRSPTHVGFFVGSALVNGRTYYKILGGNQGNMVRVSWFPAAKVIAIRRAG